MKYETSGAKKIFLPAEELLVENTPAGTDRRAFLMRSASISAAAVLTGVQPRTKRSRSEPLRRLPRRARYRRTWKSSRSPKDP